MATWIGVLGALALTVGPLWWWVGTHLVTIVHEGGHALMTTVLSGRVGAIRIYAGGAGETHSDNYDRAWVPFYLAGYLTPPAIGLGALALLHAGKTGGALVLMLAALAVILVLVRNLFGLVVVLAVGGGVYLTFRNGSPGVQVVMVSVVAWLLLLGSVRDTFGRFSGGCGDADELEDVTGIPAGAWVTLFALGASAAAGYAGYLTLTGWGG